MSSKKAMKKMQKLTFQRNKKNIRDNKFRSKKNKIFNKLKKLKNLKMKFIIPANNMKKLLGIVVLGLLWCNVGFAGHCGHDLDRDWEWGSGKTYMVWTIKNKTNKSIVITSVGLWAKDNETEMLRKKKEYYIKPFGVKEISVYVGDLNLDVSGSGFTSCRYGTISTTKTYNPPKKKKSGAKKLLEKIFGN